MILSELQTLVGSLTGDPQHDRYEIGDINTELENVQTEWNLEAKILSDTVTLTVVDGTRQYALSGLTGTPIDITRVTHKGILLEKRDKNWLDLYAGSDWTQNTGTPSLFIIEQSDPDAQYLTLHPTPGDDDAGANLVVEYTKAHTPMSSASDVPFMSDTTSNTLLRPYDHGVGYCAAYKLLMRDPSQENMAKAAGYKKTSDDILSKIIQIYKSLEQETPKRLRGGRYWNSGNVTYKA